MVLFTKNLDELVVFLKKKKCHIKRYTKKHFCENTHYIELSGIFTGKNGGGKNRIDIMLTEEAFNLIKNTYNSKHRYISKINNTKITHPLLMSVENATIGFICSILKDIIDIKRQYKVGKYYVDCYIPSENIIIECDEPGHKDYNLEDEKIREELIKKELHCEFIRFNPSDLDFDLSILINSILKRYIK